MSLATSHGPTSTPLRTSERGAGTRQPPCAQASHISSHEASKATDSPAITRSPVPSGRVLEEHPRLGVDERGGGAVRDRDPLRRPGRPGGEDHPGVVVRGRVGVGAAGARGRPRSAIARSLPTTAATRGLGEDEPGPLVGVLGVDRDVGGAGHEDARRSRRRGRRCRTGPARRPGRPGRRPTRSARPPGLGGGLGELLVGELLGPVVQRACLGYCVDGLVEDVDQGARRRRGAGPEQARTVRGRATAGSVCTP